MNFLKSYIKRMIQGPKATTEDYLKHLKQIGIEIGDDVTIYSPIHTTIDEQYPWLIKIGNHVGISQGVIILTHDYSWSVIKGLTGEIIGAAKNISIGDNVFIGMNTILLGGSEIGNNVVIGAGSIVTGKCEANSVYAGIPAKRIMDIDSYKQKRKENQLQEAKNLVNSYYERYEKYPSKEKLHEFFMLFSDENNLIPVYTEKMKLLNDFDKSYAFLKNQTAPFDSYEDFLDYCKCEEYDQCQK